MKLLSAIVLLAVLPVATSFAAQSSQVQSRTQAKKEIPETDPTLPVRHTVEPGESHTNNDGVTVENTGDGSAGEDGDITINPKSGSENSKTTVDVENHATGTVSGIDGNDTVNTAHGSNATISGTGGTVNVGSGSSGSITNNNPAGGEGASITVNVGGHELTVPPGSTVNF